MPTTVYTGVADPSSATVGGVIYTHLASPVPMQYVYIQQIKLQVIE